MAVINKKKLKAIFPKSSDKNIEEFIRVFNKYSDSFKILKPVHANFFLAQLREEVGPALKARRENLNYSCDALKKIFKVYRKNPTLANKDGRCNGHKANQENIANRAYANRIGNGDFDSGDGYRFRGGGFIQLTGRKNYQKITEVINNLLGTDFSVEDVESEINTPAMALLTAMAFWYKNKIFECKHIDCVTKKVNRFTKSYKKRKNHYMFIASL